MIDTPSVSYKTDYKPEKQKLHLKSHDKIGDIDMFKVSQHANLPSTFLDNQPLLDKVLEQEQDGTPISNINSKSYKENFDHLPSKETQEFFNIQKKKILALFFQSVVQSLPTSFSYGDFFINTLVLKLFISSTTDIELIAATAYHSAYFAILMLAISYGVMECQGILGSQALGEKNFPMVNLRLRQGIVVGLTYFVIGTCLPTLFIDNILPLFGVQPDLTQIVKELIIWTLPSTAIRIINDNLKTFLQNQGELNKVGFACIITFIPFIPLSYYIMITCQMGTWGVGIMLFYYEFATLIALGLLYRIQIPAEFKKESLPLKKQLGSFYWYALKIILSEWSSYFVWDGMNIVVGWIGSQAQLGAFSIMSSLSTVIFSVNMGLNVFTRTQFNFAIASTSKTPGTLKRIFRKLYFLTLLNGILLSFLEGIAIFCIVYFNVINDDELDKWFMSLILWELVESFLTSFSAFLKVTAKSLGELCFVTSLGTLDILAVVMAYVGGITLKKGVVGVYFAFDCVTFLKVVILNMYFLFFVNWENVTMIDFRSDINAESQNQELDSIDVENEA